MMLVKRMKSRSGKAISSRMSSLFQMTGGQVPSMDFMDCVRPFPSY